MLVYPDAVTLGMCIYVSQNDQLYKPLPLGMVHSVNVDGARIRIRSPFRDDAQPHELELIYDDGERHIFGTGWRVLEDDPLRPGKKSYGTRYTPLQLEIR